MTQSAGKQGHGAARSRTDHPVVLYDGVCNLCNASVRFIIRNDPGGVYRFAHLQSPAGAELAKRYGIDPDALNTFVLIERGSAVTRSEAWLSILEPLGGVWRAARILRVVPRPLRDAVYALVGRLRYHLFGRTRSCQLPAPGAGDRFLDAGRPGEAEPRDR